MSSQPRGPGETGHPSATAASDSAERRIAFERLRERTDELELIVSGLLAFTLIALPTWLFEHWLSASAHADRSMQVGLAMAFSIGSGFCYTLAFAFILHLAVRGYWVGLIGLKAAYPGGIQWDRVRTFGPVARGFFESRLPDLGSAIDRADRAASVLFSMTILIALLLLWVAFTMVIVAAVGAALGWLVGGRERTLLITFLAVFSLISLLSIGISLIDAVLLRRRPGLQTAGVRRWLTHLLRIHSVVLPQRLILPVQLTLQSNLKARVFFVVFLTVNFLAPLIGLAHIVPARQFTLTGGYTWFDDDDGRRGFMGAHYESLRSDHDALLRYPMIQSDTIGDAYVRLFLPYVPARDNAVLQDHCGPAQDGPAERTTPAPAGPACLVHLWSVTFDGEPVSIDDYLPAERRDLGLRGLIGYIPLAGRSPGRHDLDVVWNPNGAEDGRDRRREHHIPFWFAPAYELAADAGDPPG